MSIGDDIIVAGTLIVGIAGWFAIIIWAAWRRSWLAGGIGGILFIAMLLWISQAIGGLHPLEYGLLFGASLFLSTGIALIGVVDAILVALARRRDG